MTRYHLLVALLATANVAMGFHLKERFSQFSAASQPTRSLPSGVSAITDLSGDEIGPLDGEVVVLAFARAGDEDALTIVEDVLRNTMYDSVQFVLFAEDPATVSGRIKRDGVAVVASSLTEWMAVAEAPTNLETWSVYDADGNQRARGDFNYGGLEGALGEVAGKLPVYSSRLLAERLQPHFANDGTGFADGHYPTPRNHSFLFVGDLSSSCPIAGAIETIDNAAIGAGVPFSILVPPNWSDYEISALKANFSTLAPVQRAPVGVSTEWLDLQRVYGATSTAGFFVSFQSGQQPQVLTELASVLDAIGGPKQ